ncbi:2137_t:CDS:10 [Ambispora leptoticha]|uniref:2137_t:CDS:1 n=1 Tax=Ambispora leptoticha TaxID=144679 RepID=A0A9N9A7A8_9GLOM|nr:2137_t:CDS:10 [Ambispora leptoticha]
MANEERYNSIPLTENQQLSTEKETFDQLQVRHKKELKDLVARTTSLKKTATKGDKKRKKEVQAEIIKLEAELHARHELEVKKHKVSIENNDNDNNAIATSEEYFEKNSENANIKSDKQDENEHQAEEDIVDTLLARLESMKIEKEEPKETKKSPDERSPKPKRQQRRKALYLAFTRPPKIKEMQEQGEKEADGQINMQAIERNAIQELTKSMGLSIKEITPDGHCLYNAIADQLQFRYDISTNYKNLRKDAANYMREHFEDFLPFLTTESGDPYSMEQFQKYCDELENTATWGGQLEINALSKKYKRPVHIVQMGSPILKISDDEFPGQQPIILSYHRHMYGLGAHYNSLRKDT